MALRLFLSIASALDLGLFQTPTSAARFLSGIRGGTLGQEGSLIQ
jgi:hypothetical protein